MKRLRIIYHRVHALHVRRGTATTIVNQTLINVGAIIAISAVTVRTSAAGE